MTCISVPHKLCRCVGEEGVTFFFFYSQISCNDMGMKLASSRGLEFNAATELCSPSLAPTAEARGDCSMCSHPKGILLQSTWWKDQSTGNLIHCTSAAHRFGRPAAPLKHIFLLLLWEKTCFLFHTVLLSERIHTFIFGPSYNYIYFLLCMQIYSFFFFLYTRTYFTFDWDWWGLTVEGGAVSNWPDLRVITCIRKRCHKLGTAWILVAYHVCNGNGHTIRGVSPLARPDNCWNQTNFNGAVFV